MLLNVNNQAIIDALVTNDDSILKPLQWLGYNRERLIDSLRQSIRSSINRHYANRQKLSELEVREIDLEEYRKLDQLEINAIDYLRKQDHSLDSLVKPVQRTLQQFLRDYSNKPF